MPTNNRSQQQEKPNPHASYNRESGQKTLLLVAAIILAVTILSITSLMLINKRPAPQPSHHSTTTSH